MKELSLNILDIIENSINASAKNICVAIVEDETNDKLEITVKDDGAGMDDEFLKIVFDPFTTTSTTKKVGLGLPLLKEEAEGCDGGIGIKSKKGVGTEIYVRFRKSHIDTPALGDIASTVMCVLTTHPEINLFYTHSVNGKNFEISSELLKEACGDEFFNPAILKGVQEFLQNSIKSLYGGE